MKAVYMFFILLAIVSCNETSTMTQQEVAVITESEEYKNYVAAYNDYVYCVAARPQLTNDLLSKKIDSEEFEILLEKNTTLCALKRKLYMTHFEILKSTYNEEATALQLDASLE